MTVNAAVALLLLLLGSVAALLMVALLLTTLPLGALGSTLATCVNRRSLDFHRFRHRRGAFEPPSLIGDQDFSLDLYEAVLKATAVRQIFHVSKIKGVLYKVVRFYRHLPLRWPYDRH